MEGSQAKYMLMGINLSLFAIVLAVTSSGVGGISLLIGLAGLGIAALGWAPPPAATATEATATEVTSAGE